MKLKEIPRAATFSWSPASTHPTIVTGTAAGTIDADFNASSTLELWKLDLQDHSISSFTSSSTLKTEVDARFHDVEFNSSADIVVGALENGTVQAWKADSLESVGSNKTAHSGAVRSVSCSRQEAMKFATGGEGGQVLVWQANDLKNPLAVNTTQQAQQHGDVVQSVQWNTGTNYILASGGSNGFSRIWDTRRHREVLNLHYATPTGSFAPISCVQWHPNHSTKLATAVMDDTEPLILIWDMKNVNKPEQILKGHQKGVLSIDWCRQDSSLMLSGGKDNQTLLWNPEKGAELGAYPVSVEWVFKTQFHPKLPDLFATSSFDGKISVQTLQDTTPVVENKKSDADFWESETVLDAVHPSFKLMQPPKWLVRPVSAKFGFGGKLAIAARGKLEVRSVRDPTLDLEDSEKLAKAIESKDFRAISTDWDPVLQELLEKKELKPPVEDEIDEEDDDFFVVPQYQPHSSFNLLDSDISKLLLKNDFEQAVNKLIANDQPNDALLVASFGSKELVARAQNAYLSAHANNSSHLRTAFAVANKNYDDLVEHCELDAWPHVLQALVSGGNEEQVRKGSLAIAKRLETAHRKEDALQAVLVGKNVSAAASLWIDELPNIEKKLGSSTTAFGVRVKALHQVVEKIAAACSVLGLPKISDPQSERLFSAFRDYADLASQQGDLKLAMLFLNMLPNEYAQDKHRVEKASSSPKRTPAQLRVPPAPSVPTSTSVPTLAPTGTAAPPNMTTRTRQPVRPTTGIRPRAVAPAVSPAKPVVIPTPAPPGSVPAPALASLQKSEKQTTGPLPPPPAAGLQSAFKGWNDVPELPIQPKRARAAPAKVAPPPRQASISAPPVNGSPRASVSSQSAPSAAPVQAPPPPKAPNPYSSKVGVVRSVSGSSHSNYVPTDTHVSQQQGVPAPPRPYSRNQPVRAPSTGPSKTTSPTVAAPPPAATTITRAPPISNGPPVAPVTTANAPPTVNSPPGAPSTPQPKTGVLESPVEAIFNAELTRVGKVIEPQYPQQFKDTHRRLQLLYSQFSQLQPDIAGLVTTVGDLLNEQKYDEALVKCKDISTLYAEETKAWLVGIQRLLKMSKGVPV